MSSLDLSGYHQVPVEPDDTAKCAFASSQGGGVCL